jgi:hypothetical protein
VLRLRRPRAACSGGAEMRPEQHGKAASGSLPFRLLPFGRVQGLPLQGMSRDVPLL